MAVNETASCANMRNQAAFLTARRQLEERRSFVMLAHLVSVFCMLEKYAPLSWRSAVYCQQQTKNILQVSL